MLFIYEVFLPQAVCLRGCAYSCFLELHKSRSVFFKSGAAKFVFPMRGMAVFMFREIMSRD